MVSLYQKRQAPQVNMPNAAFNTNSGVGDAARIAGNVLDAKGEEFAKKAQENFNLGKSELINTLLNDAYKLAPDNIKQFNDIIQENLMSSVEGLPEEMQENVISSVKTKKALYDVKVFENRKKSVDAERTDLVLVNIDQEDKSTLASQESMYQSLIDGDKEVFKIAKDNYNSSLNNTKELTEFTNMKGNYILNDKAARTLRQTGEFGQMDSFSNAIDGLSLNDLKDFDESTFQDKESYQKNMGVNRDTYDSQEKYLKKRMKNLGDDEERVINDQAFFNASKQLTNFNPEELKQLQKNDVVSKKFIKEIKETQEIEPNPIFIDETTDEGFTESILELNRVLENKTGETGVEYRQQLLEVGANAGKNITSMANTLGITDEDQTKFKNAMADVMMNSDGSIDRVLKPYVYDDNATAMILKNPLPAISNFFGKTKRTLGRAAEAGYNKRTGTRAPSVFTKENEIYTKNDSVIKQAKTIAREGFKLALDFSALGNYDEAEKIFQDVNKRVIRKVNSTVIPEQELIRLEKQKAAGLDAITDLNGQYYDFEGYDNYQPIFRRR